MKLTYFPNKKLSIYIFMIVTINLFFGLIPLFGQTVHEAWETIELEHFRVHYPKAYEDWTQHLAARMEKIHDNVTSVVQYSPPKPLDVVVIDPLAMTNGAALPFLKRPRMILFTTPPPPTSSLACYQDWQQLLFTHEYVHITHLTKPPRNLLNKIYMKILLPLSPIALKSPTWLTEGYATLLEGKLTGFGRPNGSFRAMFLRELAASGLMPSYGQLNGSDRWASGAYPYLFGSAFMEWLESREGFESFVHLWRRMTAKKRRSFDDAFEGVYRLPPDELYGAFVAETTTRAVQLKKKLEREGIREGDIWHKHYRNLGWPNVSPDGDKMAIVTYDKKHPPKLEIWSTLETKEKNKKDARLLKKDPEDVPDKPSAPPERKVLHTWFTRNGYPPLSPHFLSDGKRVLFERFMPDSSGNLHPDLFIWNIDKDSTLRITKGADIKQSSPFHLSDKAVAIRSRFGKTQVVEIEFTTGELSEITPLALQPIYSYPAISPDDQKLAFIIHDVDHWELKIVEYKSGSLIWSFGNGTEIISQPVWSGDGEKLFFVSDRSGIPNIEYVEISSGQRHQISNVFSGAFAPAPHPEGKSMYYLQFWTKGFNIFKMDIANQQFQTNRNEQVTFPILPPTIIEPVHKLEPSELEEIHNYGWGKQELTTVTSVGFSPSGDHIAYGLRLGDIIGRNETIVLTSIPLVEGPRGVTLRQRIKRFPIEIFFQGFWFEDELTKNNNMTFKWDTILDQQSQGFVTALSWQTQGDGYFFSISGSGLLSEKEILKQSIHFSRNIGEVGTTISLFQGRDDTYLSQDISALYQAGITDNESWSLFRGSASLTYNNYNYVKLSGLYEYGSITGDYHETDLFQIGGLQSSLLPTIAYAPIITQPALKQGIQMGSKFDRTRLSISTHNLPLELYTEQLKAWFDEYPTPDPIRLMGLELKMNIPQFALINLAETELKIGYAKIYDGPMKDQTEFYSSLIIKP